MKILWPAVFFTLGTASVTAQRGYPPVIEGAQEFVYKAASETELKLWMFTPEGWKATDSRPAIVFFFGGGWRSGSPTQFVPHSKHLAKRGLVAFVADYRVASRHGTKAKDCVADARDAMKFVRAQANRLGVDPKRLAAGGGSAGGHIAACLGVIAGDKDSKADALTLFNPACVFAPIDGVKPWGRDRSVEMKARMGMDPVKLSPYHHVTEQAPPCVIFHGTEDTTVPFLTAELFAKEMKRAGAKCVLHSYEGEGHGFFNAGRSARKGKKPAYPQTLTQLEAFLGELGWLAVTKRSAPASPPKFSEKPVWVSGSNHCGGDGNAQLIDFDQDGDLDVVTSVPNPSRWAVFENNNGKLGKSPLWVSQPTTDCDHISVIDFNQDGLPDLAGTHESHNTLYLNRKDRGNRFGGLPDWETSFYTDSNQIDFADMDGDGDNDMLVASGLPVFQLALFENDGGKLSRTITRRLGPRLYSEASIFGDLDNDGDQDVIATYGSEGTIVVFKNLGKGEFDEGTEIFKDPVVKHVQRVYCLDFNKDGKKELFCAKGPWGPPGRSLALTYDQGSAKVIWESADNTGFHGFDFADVDGDGDLDMAAADWSGKSTSVFLQQDGVMAPNPVWSAVTRAPVHEVVFGDIDGDGDLDVVAGGLDQAMLFENLAEPAAKSQ